MQQISTLTEFLESNRLNVRCYDMGRRIVQLPRDHFLDFEQTQIPYSQPLQKQAWLALLMQPEDRNQSDDPMIWFVRFPLDEQGKLLQAARDEFMLQLVESFAQAKQLKEQNRELESLLAQSPYVYQPKQDRLAAFHARLTVDLQLAPSHYYAHARRYFAGELGWDQWSFLGYQGIADLAARHAQEGNTEIISRAIAHLPPPPLEALCHCLENEAIPSAVSQQLLARARHSLTDDKPDPQVISAALRGLSRATTTIHCRELLESVLDHPISQRSDILAAIAGRLWEGLTDADLSRRFLERLAANDQHQAFFDQILSDLLYMSESRAQLLACLRDPERSDRLSEAIGAFFFRLKQG
jgi:hypothetical protein